MHLDLKGKVALVCGASQGIGRAACEEFANLGARVLLMSRNADRLEQVKSGLKNPSHHKVLAFDLTRYQDIRSFLKESLSEEEIPVILVNNSGGPAAGPLMEVKASDFQSALASHVCVAQELIQYAFPKMKKEKFGRVINVISTSVKAPIPNLGLSNTIRGAMASWAKTLAGEVGPYGVTVNNVLPGYTETPRLKTLVEKSAEKQNLSEDQIQEMWKNTIPLRRFAKPKELAEVIAFLASESAGYINGVNIPVDGGRTPSL